VLGIASRDGLVSALLQLLDGLRLLGAEVEVYLGLGQLLLRLH
jgi:hypothetical protein